LEEGKQGRKRRGKRVQDESAVESMETDRRQKKELSFFIISTEGLVLTFLAHPGDQEFFLRKLGIESLDLPAARHADMLLHPGDPVREYQESRSGRDIGRVLDRELVAHAVTFLALMSFRYPHVLQLAFCECSA
jgi:hypothetical protein